MSDIISTDQPFTRAEQAALNGLLDTLIPSSIDARKPSAADVGFVRYLTDQDPPFIPLVKSLLAVFRDFSVQIDIEVRHERVLAYSTENPEGFREFLSRVYDCYYQNDRVREAIGVASGAPFPQGNQIVSGDLSLLDPVIAEENRHRYRKTK